MSFLPEYSRFGMDKGLKGNAPEVENVLSLMFRRVFDVAACNPDLTVELVCCVCVCVIWYAASR